MRQPSQLTYNDLNGSEAKEILIDWFRQLLSSQPVFQSHLTLPNADITLDLSVGIDMHIGGTVPVASPPEHLDIPGRVSLSTRINAAPLPGGRPPDQIRDQHGLPTTKPGYGPRETGSHLFLSDIAQATEDRQSAQSGLAGQTGLTIEDSSSSPSQIRRGIVADGYTFSPEMPAAQVIEQSIPLADGSIDIDLSGSGRMRQGDIVVTGPTHRASLKTEGDRKGSKYGSVSATYDAGPAGLASSQSRGGLGGDGRPRLSFGNSHRGNA